MATRTDIHRPGAIVPAHYTYVMSYNGATEQDGWPIPSSGYNCELDGRREIVDEAGKKIVINGSHNGTPDHPCCMVYLARLPGASIYGSPGKCGCCGSNFIYGDLWRHDNGEYLHLGHTCADKYEMLADRSAWELEMGRLRQAAATACERARRKDARDRFLAEHPGLAELLEVKHQIIEDIRRKFYGGGYCSLTDRQIELVKKLAAEAAMPAEPEVPPAPVENGRYQIEGTILGVRTDDTQYGAVTRMLVQNAARSKFWGTAPSALGDGLKGRRVRFTATVTRSDKDPGFGLFKRPAKAEYLDAAEISEREEREQREREAKWAKEAEEIAAKQQAVRNEPIETATRAADKAWREDQFRHPWKIA